MAYGNATYRGDDRPRKGQLQTLRREAGFSSANEFAARIGIPTTTYSRYERAEAKPACGIPLANAWAIADALGCSIDLVVGREPMGVDRAPVQTRYNALSKANQQRADEYLDFLEARDTEGMR